MSILKGLGIILVVIGHSGYSPFNLFPPYSFHMPLFFFISGYFYNTKYESDQLSFLKKRAKSLLLPYLIYNIIYALITFFIYTRYHLKFGKIPVFSLNNFLIRPIINGHQFLLFLAGWFIIQLFITQWLFLNINKVLKRLNCNIFIRTTIYFCLGIIAIYLANKGFNQQWKLVFTRTLIAMMFYSLGPFYRQELKDKKIFKSTIVFCLICAQIAVVLKFRSITYLMAWSDYKGHVFLPIFVSINGIYFYLLISKCLALILPNNDWLITIGEKSLHILANHLFIFFLINMFIVQMGKVNISSLNDFWFRYNIHKYWLVYVIPGVLLPTFFALISDKLKASNKVSNKATLIAE